MPLTNEDLQAAFNRSQLKSLGYSFQSAMNCAALKICLVRLATLAQNKMSEVKHPAKYWWLKY